MTIPVKELFEFDGFCLDTAEHLLLRDGEPVALEPKVFETLLALLRHGGRLVAKEALMQAVWPDSFVEESNLTRNISVLRKALNRNDGGPPYIETVPKRGYRFVGEMRAPAGEQTALIVQSARVSLVVEEEESDEETTGGSGQARRRAGEIATAQTSGSAIGWPQTFPGKLKRHKQAVGLMLALLMAGVAVVIYFGASGAGGRTVESLAVLPFVNEGAEVDTDYLSDGMTDSLINSLSQLPRLKVMSRNSVFRYKGREMDAQAAGNQLGVQAVLTGRVVTRGESLTIITELVATRDNSHLWGKQYSYKLSEILTVQAELARDISERLRLRLSGADKQRLAKHDTENQQAYELYLKGRYYLNALIPEEQKVLAYFERAIELDPNYGQAYAALAECYARLGYNGTTFSLPLREASEKAKAAALRAVELDDTLAEAHTSLALIAMTFEWDWKTAEREFKRAIALNPNYVAAHHWYSHYLISMGRFDESLAESLQALALDPLDVAMNFHLGFHYGNARQFGEAVAQLQKALAMNQNHSDAHAVLGGLVYGQQQRYTEAIAELQKSMELGGTDNRGAIGHVYAISGQRGAAQKLLDQLREEAKHKYVSPYNIAKIYAGLGEKDQAFAWLEKAYAERDSNMALFKVDAAFDRLHADPRFADLLQRVGLTP